MIDSYNIKYIREDLEKAFATVGEKRGLSFKIDRIIYSKDDFKCVLRAVVLNDNGDSFEKIEFTKNCIAFNLTPEHFNKIFKVSRITKAGNTIINKYRICGIKTRNRKYPILAKDTVSGKIFKFTVATVVRNLNKSL